MGLFHPKKRAIATMENIGDKSEACILAKLMQVGYAVLIPFGGSERYDLVIEDADGYSGAFNVRLGGMKWYGSI